MGGRGAVRQQTDEARDGVVHGGGEGVPRRAGEDGGRHAVEGSAGGRTAVLRGRGEEAWCVGLAGSAAGRGWRSATRIVTTGS